ncbi:MBL fold metallo-hydrolase [candidate division KSB1 bacterium]|nr:MBL fold metallo-hydrolase [candidate division KSB1 bacterium]
MLVKQILTGGDRNYGYVVADEKSASAAIVDPSYAPEKIVRFCRENDLKIKYVFCTHGHYDHTNGNSEIESVTGAKVLLYGDTDPQTGLSVKDGTTLPLGGLDVKIIHTPGHTLDSICIHTGDALFTGDTLFVGKVGGTDFGAGARAEYDSLFNKLLKLPEKTRVFPGHNYGTAPESTIGHEKQTNPFLLQADFESFVYLKQNWAEYKRKHGIA